MKDCAKIKRINTHGRLREGINDTLKGMFRHQERNEFITMKHKHCP